MLVFPLFPLPIYLCPLIFHVTFTAGWCVTILYFISLSGYFAHSILLIFIMQMLMEDSSSGRDRACVGAGATLATKCLRSLRAGHVPLVLCCTLPSRWFPLSSTLTGCITHRIRGISQVGGFFCRPDIVGNLHFGFTGWSWLEKNLFPRPVFPTSLLATLHFLENVGKTRETKYLAIW